MGSGEQSPTGRSHQRFRRFTALGHVAEELSECWSTRCANHLVSDVPVLIFLSGGTDSACLGALARAAGAQNLSAMTVGFGESEFDESDLTRRTAEALDIPLEVVKLGRQSSGDGSRPCDLGAG